MTNTQALIDSQPAAIKEGRTTEGRVDGAFASAVAALVLGVFALICTGAYNVSLSMARFNWWGSADSGPNTWTVQELLSDSAFWWALGGTLLPLIGSIVPLIFGARHGITKVVTPALVGTAVSGFAFLAVLLPSLGMLK